MNKKRKIEIIFILKPPIEIFLKIIISKKDKTSKLL